jgi:putative oxidoreductase
MLEFFTEYSELGTLFLSLVVAVIFAVHGWPKLKNPAGMATVMGWPVWVVRGLGTIEVIGGLAILLGMAVQFWALLLSILMIGAIYTKVNKWKIPFWSHVNTGWEFDLLVLATTIFFLTNGNY